MPRARKGQRGNETRARIVVAASDLFVSNGYLDTTMAAIAARAGVAVQTLYLSFGSKVAILEAAHDLAVVGDNEPIPVMERPWVADAHAEPDGLRALKMVMSNVRAINARVAALYGVIHAASADPEVAAVLARIRVQRLETMRALAAELASKPGFTPSQGVEWAADRLYAIGSIEFLDLLVVQREWSMEQLDEWVYEIAAAGMFPATSSAAVPVPMTYSRPSTACASTVALPRP